MLPVPGVLLTTLIVGGIVALGVGLPFAMTAVFGALIAATERLFRVYEVAVRSGPREQE
jgi:NhaP-type Na+/H+ or K+/H+ antiporter